jgi:hypothetical protein
VKGKVFVSCGQQSREERQIAREIFDLLVARGFNVYLAINVQTILEINTGIIGELKDSDFYLFVNFRHERIGRARFRGSLFSNQELAIAYAFGFEKLLVINQSGVKAEGILRYMGNNSETFRGISDCSAVVERGIDRARWTPDYTRRLRPGQLRFSNPDVLIRYGNLVGRFLYLDIHNDRPDIAALETTARLVAFARDGETFQPCEIRSPLKATARIGFSHTIFPKSHEAFDILCIGKYYTSPIIKLSGEIIEQPGLPAPQVAAYLNSALDVAPLPKLPFTCGKWILRFEIFAIGFPVLTVLIELDLPDGKSGGLCWRATRQGIPCRKLIPMSDRGGFRPPRVLNELGRRNRFPHALENSTSPASTPALMRHAHSGFRNRPATGKPARNAAALDCRSVR